MLSLLTPAESSKTIHSNFFLMLESSATCSLSIWEPGIAYGPQGHISESAALCETATIQLIRNYFYLLRMCKMIVYKNSRLHQQCQHLRGQKEMLSEACDLCLASEISGV